MGIIDKLKGTPKWKHADLAVRLEGPSPRGRELREGQGPSEGGRDPGRGLLGRKVAPLTGFLQPALPHARVNVVG